jgi:hypothetical protein
METDHVSELLELFSEITLLVFRNCIMSYIIVYSYDNLVIL